MFRKPQLVILLVVVLLVGFISSACQTAGLRGGWPPETSHQRTFVRDQLVIHADFYLPQSHRILDDLVDLRYEIAENLEISLDDRPIEVFLFRDEKKFRQFVQRHVKLPDRRAFFVKKNQRLMIFSFWGGRAEEDLRHEVTHGYLHSSFDALPLWIDEGIAEYFEINYREHRINRPHVNLLADAYRKGTWRPDLKPLEQFNNNASLNQLEYAESWLWIHFLLEYNDQTRKLLITELQRIQHAPSAAAQPFSQVIDRQLPEWRSALINHLKSLAEI
jgi:hypothetical protein